MRYNVTQLEGKNEPVNFSSSFFGIHFLELEPGNYQAKQVSQESHRKSNLLQFSRADDIDYSRLSY